MRKLMLLLVLSLGCGPVWMIPGGALRGTAAPSPATDWASLDHCEIIQLETRGSDPYSINIWAAGTGDRLYLAAAVKRKYDWKRHQALEYREWVFRLDP